MKRETLNPNELRLFEGIEATLRNGWNSVSSLTPADFSRCHSEIFHLALAGRSSAAIARYLHDIIIEKLGLASSADHADAAKSIYSLSQEYLSVLRAG